MKHVPIKILVGLGLLLALLSFTLGQPGSVAAFDHAWAVFLSTNVAAGEGALWDDIAAGGPALNEAGLLWFKNNQALDETLGYKTTQVAVSTTSFRLLNVRAALNDNALFKVGYALNNPAAPCVYPAALIWPAAQADGVYRVKSFTLPLGASVRAICVVLTDNPDAVAIGRSNVLIDYIRLQSVTGAIGWKEDFTGAP